MRKFMFIYPAAGNRISFSFESTVLMRRRCKEESADMARLDEFIELAKPGDYFSDGDILIVEVRNEQ